MLTKDEITDWFKNLQDNICKELETADGLAKFREDFWEREGGGGGRSRTIANGEVIEKGGVGFSAVHGETPENILKALKLEKTGFYATGVSIVLHPQNPRVPIIHMNVRYFEMTNGTWWFGGGIDLTPHYVDKEDARYFHQKLKSVCDNHDSSYYGKFKKWADDYFFIKHRSETRGIGGIFFDRLGAEQPKSKEELFAFVKEVGSSFAPIYTYFMHKNKSISYGEREKQWQMIRRGRYVEFNLVWDKGTKFGLDTGGRTESILMSLPPQANWLYDHKPEDDSEEAKTLELLKKDINWA
ncbi:oxygen-dependent coproporphyrinogen oxidase [Fulvivirga ulvae]|uniref:oxygen-dependent coproporphyrinogen oxidase n=1 Tax=Fulvivirga ulvae TaxID=2904245 RepID=UPI001F208CC8|nr:oxygen-dependent coproporphyrinogen oxidase [Fulvivirga ulvae]UII30368.1 oxygen-dependent coproporphyrinogen oxidase [Fulvivirga ulvae]